MTFKLDCGCKPKQHGTSERLFPEDMCPDHKLEWYDRHLNALKEHKARMAAFNAFNDALLGNYRWEDVP